MLIIDLKFKINDKRKQQQQQMPFTSLLLLIIIIINIKNVKGCYCPFEKSAGHYCGDELTDDCEKNIVYECSKGSGNDQFLQQRRLQQQKRPIIRQVDDCRQTSCIRSTDKEPAQCWRKLTTSIVVND